jgi:hypothetical protein
MKKGERISHGERVEQLDSEVDHLRGILRKVTVTLNPEDGETLVQCAERIMNELYRLRREHE